MRPLHVLLCLTAAVTILAQDAQLRIGIVAPSHVIETSNRGSNLFKDLELFRKNIETKLRSMNDEIQKLSNQLQSPSIGEPGKERIGKQLRDLDFEIKKFQEDSEIELQKKSQTIFTQFENEIMPFITELAKEQNLQLVLNFHPSFVAYYDPTCTLNFSNEVVKRYDAKYKSEIPSITGSNIQKATPEPTHKPTR
jgi:Skp family chaperone for outer membrane proteins